MVAASGTSGDGAARRQGGGAHLPLGVVLLALLAASNGEGRHRGPISRMASAATEAVGNAVGPDAIVEHVDVNALVERIDIDELVQRIDIDTLVQRIDIDELVSKIDIDTLVGRIDIDTLVSRIDINALVQRIDMNELLDSVDIPALVDRAGVADIVAESTGNVAGSMLDVVRRQLVAVDEIVGRLAYSLARRDPMKRPSAPPKLLEAAADTPTKQGRGQRTGFYAGPVTRTAAFALDIGIVLLSITLLGAGLAFIGRIFGIDISLDSGAIAGVVLLVLWVFTYFALSLAIAAQTIGKGLVGLRIVARDGSPMHGRMAVVRTLVEPFSFLFFGLGCLMILVSPERRSLHDMAARTVVVYDWGDRAADIPAPLAAWIERRQDDEDAEDAAA